MLESSAIPVELVEQRGYRTVRTKSELVGLGFGQAQARVPALLIPILDVHGQVASHQIRPDAPRWLDGKPVKYETPRKSAMQLDVPPAARTWLGDPKRPLFVTEGVKKADSAVAKSLCCVDVLGVWNWRGRNEEGGLTALAAWDSIALNERDVHIVFDSDVMTKPAVHTALVRLKRYLEGHKAKVSVIYLPPKEGGGKVGLDDFFAAGGTVADLMKHVSSDVVEPEGAQGARIPEYEIKNDGIRRYGSRLTNFGAWIRSEITYDDGASTTKVFRIQAALEERRVEFDVDAGEFDAMRWPTQHIGAGATLLPVDGVEKYVRAAIQLDSGVKAPRATVYLHTGWIKVGEESVYLHAGGGLGPNGHREDVRVDLEGPLAILRLPAPGDATVLRPSIEAVLALLDVAPFRITVPLLAAALRVVIAECDFSIHLVGASGVFKTALAALIQQFFGPEMNARSLPGSWTSTGNSIEALAFLAKDAILVVDDFAPSGGPTETHRLQQTAERVFRAQGNRAGRGRCATDGSLRKVRHPRGLLLSTGEDSPRGASVRARLLPIEVKPGDVVLARLSSAQADASDGHFARVLASFVKWLAPQLDAVRARLKTRVEAIRADMAASGLHRRIPGIFADLLFGLESFCEFATALDMLSVERANDLLARARDALTEAARSQHGEQTIAQPHERFVRLLRSALTAGDAHLTDRSGDCPENPTSWGWQSVEVMVAGGPQFTWRAQGRHVGWVDVDDVFLDIEAAVRAAQAVGNATGDPLAIGSRTLVKRLSDAGVLKSVDPDGQHLEVERTVSGHRERVVHLDAMALQGGLEPIPVEVALPSAPTPDLPEVPQPRETLAASPRKVATAPRPSACFNCGGASFWKRADGSWICDRCHPHKDGAKQ